MICMINYEQYVTVPHFGLLLWLLGQVVQSPGGGRGRTKDTAQTVALRQLRSRIGNVVLESGNVAAGCGIVF